MLTLNRQDLSPLAVTGIAELPECLRLQTETQIFIQIHNTAQTRSIKNHMEQLLKILKFTDEDKESALTSRRKEGCDFLGAELGAPKQPRAPPSSGEERTAHTSGGSTQVPQGIVIGNCSCVKKNRLN